MKSQPIELIKHYKKLYGREESDFRNANLRSLVVSKLKPGSVLDVGCGTGKMSCDAYFAGHKVVVATDIETKLLHLATKNAKATRAKIKTYRLSVNQITKLGKNKFDNVICLDVVEHVKDDVSAIRNINYVLKRGGRLILVVPAFQSLFGKRDRQMGHFRRYGMKNIIDIIQNDDFKIIGKRYWNIFGLVVYYFFEKVINRRVNESIRYRPRGLFQKIIQKGIYLWIKYVENKFEFPIGLSVFVVAEKK